MRLRIRKAVGAVGLSVALVAWILSLVTALEQRAADNDIRQIAEGRVSANRISSSDAYVAEVRGFAIGFGIVTLPLPFANFFRAKVPGTTTACIEGRKAFTQSVSIRPSGLAEHNLGWLMTSCGYLGAEKHFQKAVELAPTEPLYQVSDGLLLETIGDRENAEAQYASAIAIAPRIAQSGFFADLQLRDPEVAFKSLHLAMDQVSHHTMTSVERAKVASLKVSAGDKNGCQEALALSHQRQDLGGVFLTLSRCPSASSEEIRNLLIASRLDPGDIGLTLGTRLHIGTGEELAPDQKHMLLSWADDLPRMTYETADDFSRTDQRSIIFANNILPQRLAAYVTFSTIGQRNCSVLGHSRSQFTIEEWRKVSFLLASLCAERWLRY